MTSKQKLSDIRYLINEFYSTDEDREALTEDAKMSRRIFNEYCEEIKKDLEILEILKPRLINAEIGKFEYNMGDYELVHPKLSLSVEDYDKIKRWLGEEH